VDRTFRLEHGDVGEGLSASTRDEAAELVVAGSRGRHPLTAALLGSVSAQLARTCPRPVVIVPPEVGEWPPPAPAGTRPSVVCGVDGSAWSQGAAAVAHELARRLDLRLVLAHAYRPEGTSRAHREILEDLPMLLEGEREVANSVLSKASAELEGAHRAGLRSVPGDPVEGLLRLAREETAALLVVGSRGLGAADAVLLGSTSAALAASAPVPVVVLPPGGRLCTSPTLDCDRALRVDGTA
jgi:nucleotide-binding universal stress UspA family protein